MKRDLMRVVDTLWRTLLELELEAPPDGARRPQRQAVVELSGAFRGRVVLAASPALASRLAQQLLGADRVSAEQVDDALGELANILAGNLKALFPAPVSLGLPRVGDAAPVPGQPLAELAYACLSEPLTVMVSGS
jgi:chemotaxis protein CheX